MPGSLRDSFPWCPFLAVALALLGPARPAAAGSPTIREDLWTTNGGVYAAAISGDTLYVGGGFTEVGPATGGGVPIDASTGKPEGGFPKVTGYVYAIATDGSGGWFIGGAFTAVGGLARQNLAHILADRSVSAWQADADLPVFALVRDGATVFAGGLFTRVAGQPRAALAALDATSAELGSWDAHAASGDPWGPGVQALALRGSTLLVGGRFLSLGGQARRHLAALDRVTAEATEWNPNPDGPVSALAVGDSAIYVGGEFLHIAGQARSNLAALDAEHAVALAWDPRPDVAPYGDTPSIFSLRVVDSRVYVAGRFLELAGREHRFIAALDATTGTASAWDPGADDLVYAIEAQGSTVYVAGAFHQIGGQSRRFLAALDSLTAAASDWDPRPNLAANALAVGGSTIYAGGGFTSVGSESRSCLASFDLTTGAATGWDPRADDLVATLAIDHGVVYVGGFFRHVSGVTRAHAAALDAVSGRLTGWDPGTDGTVYDLALHGDRVYLGGYFGSIGGGAPAYLARVDTVTGQADAWDPQLSAGVYCLKRFSSRLYAGGNFRSAGGEVRGFGAAWNLSDGSLSAWDPVADGPLAALDVTDRGVYLGGHFTSIGGEPRNGLAAVDSEQGLVRAWDPDPRNDSIYDPADADGIHVEGGSVYVGGGFTRIGGQNRDRLASLDAVTGDSDEWNPGANNHVRTFVVKDGVVYAGGNFTVAGGQPHCGIVAFTAATAAAPIAHGPSRAAALLPNRPNPFGDDTTIPFSLAAPGRVRLEVFDLAGRVVATPVPDQVRAPGVHEVAFTATHLPAGVYLARLRAGGVVFTRRIVHVR